MPSRAYESIESSSPIVTRAVAAGLQDRYAENYPLPAWQRTLLRVLGRLPQEIGRFAITRFQAFSGLPRNSLKNFTLDELIRARLEDYALLQGRLPAVMAGPALGGATTTLALATRAAFLPQAFVLSLRGGAPDGDVKTYLLRTLDDALRLAARDPRLVTIQHYDPVHDGWLTRFVNHLRFKLITLPAQYADFIRARLQPGGAVIYLQGGAQWLRYRLGPRSVFQVGGWGDIPPEEFLESSPRIRAYARQAGLKFTDWRLTAFPLEYGPESEWGSEPGLGEALEAFCAAEGYRFVRIPLPHPNDFSRLAFAAAAQLIEQDGRTPQGVSVECFSQFDSTAARRGSLLPLWLIFNTTDSARYLKEMSAQFPPGKPVFFSPLATFSITPDMAAWQDWEDAIGREFINTGARRSHYPADARAVLDAGRALREWVAAHPQPIQSVLSGETLAALAQGLTAT